MVQWLYFSKDLRYRCHSGRHKIREHHVIWNVTAWQGRAGGEDPSSGLDNGLSTGWVSAGEFGGEGGTITNVNYCRIQLPKNGLLCNVVCLIVSGTSMQCVCDIGPTGDNLLEQQQDTRQDKILLVQTQDQCLWIFSMSPGEPAPAVDGSRGLLNGWQHVHSQLHWLEMWSIFLDKDIIWSPSNICLVPVEVARVSCLHRYIYLSFQMGTCPPDVLCPIS